jgi:hypothetical protein
MPAKRTTVSRRQHWRITPTAVSIWKIVCEIQAQPRDRRGQLSPEDDIALRDACIALAREVGFSKFDVGIELAVGVGDEPPDYFRNNSAQLQVWQEAKQIKTALDRALLQATV